MDADQHCPHIKSTSDYSLPSNGRGADQKDSHFKWISDHSLPSNERAVEWMLISRIQISSPHKTTYSLAMGGQQDGC